MKKVNFNQPIKSLSGEPFKSGEELVLMKSVVSNALCYVSPKKKDDLIKQFDLALRIFNSNTDIELSETEATLVKDAVMGNDLTPIASAQILKLIE